MATRVPLIVDTSTLYIKELPVGDSLDLSGSGLTQITAIGATTGNFSGIVTASAFYVDSNVVLTNGRELSNIASVDATTKATLESALQTGPNNFDYLNVTGVSTISVSSGSTAFAVTQSGAGPGVHIVGTAGTALFVEGKSQLTRVAITTTATDLTLESGISYAFYSGTSTLTLPSSPTAGDTLRIINRSGNITTLIARNGSNIMGVADDVTFDLTNETFNFTYANATDGWIISR